MKRSVLLAVIVVLVVAIVAVVIVIFQRESINQKRASLPPIATSSTAATVTTISSSSVSPTTTVQSSTVTSATTSTSASSSVVEQAPQVPVIQPVAPAVPTGINIHQPGIDLDAIVDSMPFSKDLTPIACVNTPDPNCPNTAYYVADSLGTAPGYPTNNSTYIIGHAWSEGPRVFNQLSDLLLRGVSLTGYLITVDTPNGSITYRVTGVEGIRKAEISQAAHLWDVVPNRLVLLMCALDRDYNYAIYAEVESTQPN